MITREALDFLQRHQPMPSTDACSDETISRFNEVRQYFLEHPDNRCVPLFLHAFGEGDLHGVYVLVEDTILAHPKEVVIPALASALTSSHSGVRYWSAQIAANYTDEILIEPLVGLLLRGGLDERIAAVVALER